LVGWGGGFVRAWGAAHIKFATRCLFSIQQQTAQGSDESLQPLALVCLVSCLWLFVARVIYPHTHTRLQPLRERKKTNSAVLEKKKWNFFFQRENLFLYRREGPKKRVNALQLFSFSLLLLLLFLVVQVVIYQNPRQVNGIHESSDILFPFWDGRMVASIPDDRSISLSLLFSFFFVQFFLFFLLPS
jgi:hypothetical protein